MNIGWFFDLMDLQYIHTQERNQDSAKVGAWKSKILWGHLMTNFRWRHKNDFACNFLTFYCFKPIFKTINWPNYATLDHWVTKKNKTIWYLIFYLFFLNLSWLREGLQPTSVCAFIQTPKMRVKGWSGLSGSCSAISVHLSVENRDNTHHPRWD